MFITALLEVSFYTDILPMLTQLIEEIVNETFASQAAAGDQCFETLDLYSSLPDFVVITSYYSWT